MDLIFAIGFKPDRVIGITPVPYLLIRNERKEYYDIYKQLNGNVLQIENEFYSTIRPKQIAESCEKPTLALKQRGVKYIEIRSLDLDIFNPIGINEGKSRFIEAFLLTCLLQESPESSDQEQQINNTNQLAVAHLGRKPGLELNKTGQDISLKNWAEEILQSMQSVCDILDKDLTEKPYSKALKQQAKVIENPELTPSAKILQGMRENKQPFGCFGLKTSELHKEYFMKNKLDKITTEQFDQMAVESHNKQQQIEANDSLSFDAFLERYFSQV
jgi:glutamate--cysteine ligase